MFSTLHNMIYADLGHYKILHPKVAAEKCHEHYHDFSHLLV